MLWKKIRGTIETLFQIGLGGPQLKNNGGVLEVKDENDSSFARMKAGSPVDDNDVATKYFVSTINGFVIVSDQADTSISLPNNTGVKRNLVVTTEGSGASYGDLLYDDGSGSGSMTIVSAVANRSIAVTQALSGGVITFDADSIYTWDADGGSWIKVGDIGSVTGPIRVLRFAVGNATTDSVFELPANSRVLSAKLEIVTPYGAGRTINIGTTATADLFQDGVNAPKDNNPQGSAGNIYEVEQDTDSGAVSVARVTVSSTGVGASIATIFFSNPNV